MEKKLSFLRIRKLEKWEGFLRIFLCVFSETHKDLRGLSYHAERI